MEYKRLILEKEGGIATITLNRPDRLNALNSWLRDEIVEAVDEADADDEIRTIIITGAGRGFCSGADLSPDSREDYPEWPGRRKRLEPLGTFGEMIMRIQACDKPVLAAVNGAATGAGLALALACDIRFASEQARFSAIFVRRGLHPDSGASFLLPRIVGTAKALEMMWTGDIVGAEEALRIGLVKEVVPADELLPTTQAFAERLAKGPALSIELAKRITYHGLGFQELETFIAYESWAQSICGASEDVQEGRMSFFEKREPVFRGR